MYQVPSSAFGEAEAIGADDNAVLKDDVVAQKAVLADNGVSMSEEVVPAVTRRIDDDVGEDDGVVTDRDSSPITA